MYVLDVCATHNIRIALINDNQLKKIKIIKIREVKAIENRL
jgi:hypothetical protein